MTRSAVCGLTTLAMLAGVAVARPRQARRAPTREPSSRVAHDLAVFDEAVAQRKAALRRRERPQPQDPIWVARALAVMVEIDRLLRQGLAELPYRNDYSASERAELAPAIARRFQLADGANAQDLAALVAINGWITISEFGAQANHDASLILLHADADRAFQTRVLGALAPLIAHHDTEPESFVTLLDRLAAIGDGRPQRYGTQGRCVGALAWEPYPIEDPAHVDARRALFGLEPLAVARRRRAARCRHADTLPR